MLQLGNQSQDSFEVPKYIYFSQYPKQIKQNVILRYHWDTCLMVGFRNTIRCALSKWHIFFDMSSDLIIALSLHLYIDALSCRIKLRFVPNSSIFLKVCIAHIRENQFWPSCSNYSNRLKNTVSVDKYR